MLNGCFNHHGITSHRAANLFARWQERVCNAKTALIFKSGKSKWKTSHNTIHFTLTAIATTALLLWLSLRLLLTELFWYFQLKQLKRQHHGQMPINQTILISDYNSIQLLQNFMKYIFFYFRSTRCKIKQKY